MNPYYQDDRVTIYHGDCIELLRDFKDNEFDLVVTDPPYGIEKTGSKKGDYDLIEDNEESLIKLIDRSIDNILRVGEVCLLTPGHLNIKKYPQPSWILAWVYGTTNNSNKWGFTSWQPILAYGKDPYLKNGLGRRMDIIKDSKVPEKNGHPCPKPISFVKKLIQRGHPESCGVANILDPFMGSGTTMRAAKEMGYKSVGIELSERYCEIAANRCRQEELF